MAGKKIPSSRMGPSQWYIDVLVRERGATVAHRYREKLTRVLARKLAANVLLRGYVDIDDKLHEVLGIVVDRSPGGFFL